MPPSSVQARKPTGIHLDFGIFDCGGCSEEEEGAADIYENRLELAEFADKNDFYAFHLVEHHTTPLCIAPSPGIFLSAHHLYEDGQRTSRIRIGPLGFLLPFHNPLRLYHICTSTEICMLDHLCQGRLELGFARGVVPMEAERFGLPPCTDGGTPRHDAGGAGRTAIRLQQRDAGL